MEGNNNNHNLDNDSKINDRLNDSQKSDPDVKNETFADVEIHFKIPGSLYSAIKALWIAINRNIIVKYSLIYIESVLSFMRRNFD